MTTEMQTKFVVFSFPQLQHIAKLLTNQGFARLRIAGTVESRKGPWRWRQVDGREVTVFLVPKRVGICEKDSSLHLENENHICHEWHL